MITAVFTRNALAIRAISLVMILGPSDRQQLPQSRQSVSATTSLCNSCISLSIFISRCLFFVNHFSHVGFLSATFIRNVEISILFSCKSTLFYRRYVLLFLIYFVFL